MQFSVSTQCPSCGGEIEFEEGTNAVNCGFCGSRHLVTGRGRVLSYYIPEKITIKEAANLARTGLRGIGETGWRVDEATLFFVPFFRFTGQELRWDMREVVVDPREDGIKFSIEYGSGGLRATSAGFNSSGSRRFVERRYELTGRHTDRSMPALDVAELKVASLGIRPGILKLSLFVEGRLCERGLRAPVRRDSSEMETQGFSPASMEDMFARRVFARTRSLIFFPYWLVEVTRRGGEDGTERSVVAVDAVSGDVVNHHADGSLVEKLVGKDGMGFEAAGLRPLKCPNCASDLPVRPKDVVFFCSECNKAWHVSGSEFTEVRYKVARPSVAGKGDPVYLPFWVMRARVEAEGLVLDTKADMLRLAPQVGGVKEEDSGVPFRIFLPAFRMGSLNVLSRLAFTFTRLQPVFELDAKDGVSALSGSYLSPEDAVEVAPMILVDAMPKGGNGRAMKSAAEAKVVPLETELVLVPFYKGRFEYTDGIVGYTLPIAALKG